jgi:hypothetical protein
MFCLLYSPKQKILKFHAQKQIGKSYMIDIFTSEDMENISLCSFPYLTLYQQENVIKYPCPYRDTKTNSDVARGRGGAGQGSGSPGKILDWKNTEQYKHVNKIFISCNRIVLSFHVFNVLDSFVIK